MTKFDRTEVEDYALTTLPDLYDYVRTPSISAQHKGIDETVAWLQGQFQALGAETVTAWHDQGGNPVVFAEFKGQSDRTVLFYNHYDVQPPEPLDEWESEPFDPTERDGKVYARGIQDDKGELMSRLVAMRWLKAHGGFPLNIKFFVEGEEEVGSVHVDDYVKAHAAELQADTCIWEGGGKNAKGEFDIGCGLKGVVSFDLFVQTADKDVHSGSGAFVDNAAWRMVKALSSLRDNDNNILVDGFYDDIKPLDPAALEILKNKPFEGAALVADRGLKRPFTTDQPILDTATKPTMTINGLSSGYEGSGIKTIIPKTATAKLDCRLASGQDPHVMAQRVQDQLIKNGFGDVKLTYNIGEPAFASPVSDPDIQSAIKLAKALYPGVSVGPMGGGSGPAVQFALGLQVPLIMIGVGGNGGHSPNEYIVKADFAQATYYLLELLSEYAKDPAARA